MKQGTPHLGALSGLINNGRSNRGGQFRKSTYIRVEDWHMVNSSELVNKGLRRL
jgi:hypothetical protein